MPSPRDIQKRIKAVGNIKRITKTMQMIATSKFAKAQQSATASKPYTEGIFQLVTELAARAGNISHPLIDGPPTRSQDAKHLLLVMTSDRGLCGPYNGSVFRLAASHLKELGGTDQVEIDVVGRKGASALKFHRFPIAAQHKEFNDKTPRHEDVERLAQSYMDRFSAGEIASVTVVFMRFISTSRQSPEALQILPLKPPTSVEEDGAKGSGYSAQYQFSPSPDELLNDLLPETVRATLFQCFCDAIVSEHVARMIAMKSATDNAGKMGKELTRKYNRARQAQITTELTEIIGGAAALE